MLAGSINHAARTPECARAGMEPSRASFVLMGVAIAVAGVVPVLRIAAVPQYQLVWADEFDKDGAPDPASWTFEHGFVRNQELQWYQPQNAHVERGMLVIEA